MNCWKVRMNLSKYLSGLVVVSALSACGGGGGSAGAVSGGSSTVTKSALNIGLTIVDASDVAPSSNSISTGASFFARAAVTDASGAAVVNKLVNFSTTSTVATLSQPSALTDLKGVAKVQITPASVTSVSAGNLVATATLDTSTGSSAFTANVDYQTAAANVTLTDLKASPASISALQSVAVSVEGRVNGVLVGSSIVVVNYSASCGTFSPASAPTNNSGVASSTYQSAVTCSGPVTLTAEASGATVVKTIVAVAAAQAANIVFTSATAPLIVTSEASGGLKQSTLKFQVLDSAGVGMAGQSVSIALGGSTISAGVTFSVSGVGTISPQVVTTDSSGFASVTITSGSLPTPVVVTAALVSNPLVKAASSNVSVTSGRATQNAASLSATKLSIEAYRTDGVQTSFSMRVADRQGNPVPAGAIVNFVASHGLVQGSCAIDIASQCSVTYTSQGLIRGFEDKGLVAILAYMDGEESFIDLNGDNIWQAGEPFFDVGTLYRDDNRNGAFDSSFEQTYPGGSTGASVCSNPREAYPSIASTCDGTWSSNIRVRKQIVIALATSNAVITAVSGRSSSGFTVSVTDANGNAMPTGSTVTAKVLTSGAVCKVEGAVSPNAVDNSSAGSLHFVSLDQAADCLAVTVNVIVTSPAGFVTTRGF